MEKGPETFTIIPNWMTVKDYAKACGVVNRTIVERMERGDIAHVRVHGIDVIDTKASPPTKAMYGKREKPHGFVWPPTMPHKDELVWVGRFVSEQGVRGDSLYRAVLYGRVQGWGVAGRVVIKRADAMAVLGR